MSQMRLRRGLEMLSVRVFIVLLPAWTLALQCSVNEQIVDCPANCPQDYCPKSDGLQQACARPDPCPPPACKCRFNYRRAENGTCIPTPSCTPFDCSSRPNERYVACPPYCPTDDCNQATPDGRCPYMGHILIILECTPKCRCIENFWRKNGVCVPYSQCNNER